LGLLISRIECYLMQQARRIAYARSDPTKGSRAVRVSLYLPELNLVYSLVLICLCLRKAFRPAETEVCYGHRPRKDRKFSSYMKLASNLLIRFVFMIIKFKLTPLGEGDSIPNYPYVHARSIEIPAEIIKALLPSLMKDIYYQCLKLLLKDSDSASAYVCKQMGHYTFFPVVRQTLVWRQFQLDRDLRPRMLFIMPLSWPTEWRPVIREHLLGDDIEIINVRILSITGLGFKSWLLLRLTLALVKQVVSNGIGHNTIGDGKEYRLIREFMDPDALGGRAQDNDYLIRHDQLRSDELLFYVTPYQEQILHGRSHNKEQVRKVLTSKGFDVIFFSDLRLTGTSLVQIMRFITLSSIKLLWSIHGWYPIGNILISGFQDYIQFAPFFHQVSAQVHLSFSHHQGWTFFRKNNGILAALCRQRGIVNASYQARAYWSHGYEFPFEALDLFMLWGPAWQKFLEPYLMHVKRIEYIGDIFVDDLSIAIGTPSKHKIQFDAQRQINIGLLTGDVANAFTIGYNLRFLNAACRIANKYEKVKLLVKPKVPMYWDMFLKDEEFVRHSQVLGDRLVPVLDERHHIERIVESSDILLCIGYTTPGMDALLYGKRVIFYDETGCGDDLYGSVPKLLTKSTEEMEFLVDEALSTPQNYHQIYSRELDKLDPYRDGCASKRIYSLLFEKNEGTYLED